MSLSLHPAHCDCTSGVSLPAEEQRNLAKLRLVLAIATTGRRAILSETLADVSRQTRLPDLVVLSVAGPEDYDSAALLALPVPRMVVTGPKGLCAQRNRALEVLGEADILMLIDDDFLMAPDYLARLVALFEGRSALVMATGRVLADGIGGAGLTPAEGRARLAAANSSGGVPEPVYNGYGCNMAIRALPVVRRRLRFDERLPLYGWLEDVDFSRRLAAHGEILRVPGLEGVHLGTKTGRQSGVRLGYSQVANPLYLIGKGTMARRRAARLMAGNFAANLTRSLRPEPWVDRRGRLRGNLLALADLLRGRLAPERVLDLG